MGKLGEKQSGYDEMKKQMAEEYEMRITRLQTQLNMEAEERKKIQVRLRLERCCCCSTQIAKGCLFCSLVCS